MKDQTAVPIRLSKTEMSVIFPGLHFMVTAWRVREQTGTSLSYPFRLYRLPRGYDIGTFSPAMMNRIRGLWTRLKPKAKTGGRVRLNAFELRIAILASRVNLKSRRHEARLMRRKDAKTQRRLGFDKDSIAKLRKKTRPVIKSLEKTMKRANRRFLKEVSKEEFQSQSKQWQAHLRWINYHMLYFKTLLPVDRWARSRQRKQIDQLVAIAEAGLQDQAYEVPSKKELRSMMRRFARYSRRGRMGEYHHRFVLQNPESWNAQFALVDFLEKQLDLKRVPDEPAMSSGQPVQPAQEVPETVELTKPPVKAPVENLRRPKPNLSPAQKQRLAEFFKRRPRPTRTSPS